MPNIIKSSYTNMMKNKPVVLKTSASGISDASGDLSEDKVIPESDEIDGTEKPDSTKILDEAEKNAARILDEARREASGITSQAENDAGMLKEIAAKTGYDEGYNEGYLEAQQKLEDIFAGAQKKIDDTLKEAYDRHDTIIADAEQDILRLAIQIAEKIIGSELEKNDSAFIDMVSRAIGEIKSEKHVTLRVNPGEYVRYFNAREMSLVTGQGSVDATIINDPAVGSAGCLIETDSGAVDAGVSAQLGQIAKGFGLDEF